MLKPVIINAIPRNQRALERVAQLAVMMGMSKSQAAVYLIENAPEPLSPTRRNKTHEHPAD